MMMLSVDMLRSITMQLSPAFFLGEVFTINLLCCSPSVGRPYDNVIRPGSRASAWP